MRKLIAIRVPRLSGADPHDLGDLEEIRLRQLVVAPILKETELPLSAEALKHRVPRIKVALEIEEKSTPVLRLVHDVWVAVNLTRLDVAVEVLLILVSDDTRFPGAVVVQLGELVFDDKCLQQSSMQVRAVHLAWKVSTTSGDKDGLT